MPPVSTILTGFAGKTVSFHQHHPLGKNHDPNLTTLVCLNCHARAHEKLLNSGVNMEYEPDSRRRAIMMLRALGIHHEFIAESVYKIANGLEEER